MSPRLREAVVAVVAVGVVVDWMGVAVSSIVDLLGLMWCLLTGTTIK
jgi:hypothetical protein